MRTAGGCSIMKKVSRAIQSVGDWVKAARKVYLAIAIIVVIGAVLVGLLWWNFRVNRLSDVPAPAPPIERPGDDAPLVVSLAQNLEVPWALDFLPDGSFILTERSGKIRLVDLGDGLLSEPLLVIAEVTQRGEGGLLGIAVHPDFSQNSFIYVYYTYQQGNDLSNRVERFYIPDRTLVERKVIIQGIPGASIHNGGRLKFGPDGMLYVTTGDAAMPNLAQDRDSLTGKILRLRDDGSIPVDNPFPGSPVYSLGHRNPQGLAWDSQERLWATEHSSSASDELNLIQPGQNYGWPVVRGDEVANGMISPVIHSGSDTWAPSGLAFLDGSLYFAGLRGQSLYQVTLPNQPGIPKRHLRQSFGRLREVAVGPDDFLYILTSNRDGRGVPASGDDQLIRINPDKL